jgi:hypothetical protein
MGLLIDETGNTLDTTMVIKMMNNRLCDSWGRCEPQQGQILGVK